MSFTKLSDVMIIPTVRMALTEDLGRAGDITSQALLDAEAQGKAVLKARQDGVLAGMDYARHTFALMGPQIKFHTYVQDGNEVRADTILAEVSGKITALLAAERTALNFVSHLSGVASLTARMQKACEPHKARVCCTRKTTPGLRLAEKYAVRVGGGMNHRFGLDDAVLIKDNHIAALGGDVIEAISKARASIGHMVKIEVEVDSLDQLEKLLEQPVDAVLLDNMSCEDMTRAVQMVQGRFVLEASGRVSEERIAEIAATGVDMISVGALTHSAPILDIGLDYVC